MRFLVPVLIVATTACSPPSPTPPPSVTQSASGVRAPLPWASPSEVGVSAEGLELIGPAMQEWVDEGKVAGVVTMVARRGQLVHWNAVGVRDLASGEPLKINDIFRIFSMTKPVTAVAVMMLVEEGKVALDDPVALHLPAFSAIEVYNDGVPVPPDRPMTVEDLLRHTSGLVYGPQMATTPIDEMYGDVQVWRANNLGQMIDRLATVPLMDHPGTRFRYSIASDVLGGLVEAVSGMPFAEFLQERIFDPLRMSETAFYVTPDKADRLMTLHSFDDEGALIATPGSWATTATTEPEWPSGGGGLFSTAADYARFAQMLLNGGELDGTRLLRPETIALMSSNRLRDEQVPIEFGGSGKLDGYGYGLGFGVLVDEDATPYPDNNGTFMWVGIGSTYFWVDPEAEIVALVMTQFLPSVQPIDIDFWTVVYHALEDFPR